ncbi:sigma-70 family RNA polymerase sigma factor [Rehaibacterium terrae]|uniref:RNA polymerase sigma-70 factor (ECF subfamily) n=1 Tax=Rehaibacterium terrae TaxID=1341696 RepID=A0A7W8DE67_9GAMM|nr:RNA polymerase sigma-70 factor (ECF subfamily) [Rehaibacterium terrae]
MNAEPASAIEEAALVARARQGDGDAFAALYRLHGRAIYALALRISGDPATAEDIVQDTFLKALQSLGGFRGDAPLRAWLKRMASNLAIDRLRAARPTLNLDDVQIDAAEPSTERRLDALGLLARLSPQARTVVWLHQMEGYSHPEIAALFGHTESWSKSILSRALARLRGWLEESP